MEVHHPKRLYRSRHERIIAGVAGGTAEYFAIDPILVRLVFFILIFTSGGLMLLIYLVLAIALPLEPGEEIEVDRKEKVREFVEGVSEKAGTLVDEFNGKREEIRNSYYRKRAIAAFILIGIGLLALLDEFFPMAWFRWDVIWPSILILIGALLIFKR